MTLADPSHPLNTQQAQSAFSKILDGECPADEVSAFLVALADRGETATEIAVAASEMRKRMVTADAPENAIDVCGTGGDGSHSLNISTAAALVVAACDVPMAKHGNRAASSKSGAADTLEALGLDLAKAATGGEESLRDVGIGFFFAPNHHPALGPLVPVRKAIGRRTIFNLLGPLCNPARVKRQLIGVATPDLVRTYADAALQLGYEKAMIVSGEEGLDELSISGPSKVAIVERGQITESRICPKDVGLPSHPADAIKGGDPAYNAAALEKLLLGEASAYRDAVLLNSAAGLLVAGEVESWEAGVEEAAEAIDKG
ncbi:anthranilate phosphoribosyltransferase, partial [Parasphingorhabdus sp.]